ncbi:MAG: CoA-binding protein [Halobacteria archaeon]|nr:CoA-binding protein [Halobacteria archaeon]
MPITDDDGLRQVLEMRNVAVVGCSTTPTKEAHRIPKYLKENGYDVVPVNPHADEVLGAKSYDSLVEADEAGEEIEVVDVFRPSEEVSGIVDDAIEVDADAVWTQLGIRDREAAERAEDAGLRFVEDRCMKVEHERLIS